METVLKAHAVGQIVGPDKHRIHPGHGGNGSGIGHALWGFHHQHQRHILVAALGVRRPAKGTVASGAGRKRAAALAADARCTGRQGVLDPLHQRGRMGSRVHHRDLQRTGANVQGTGNVLLQTTHHHGQLAGPGRAQHVLGALNAGAAMLVVDDQKIKTGKGAHLYQRRGRDAIEDAAQAPWAAQQIRQAGIERADRWVHGRLQSWSLAILAPSAMLASLAKQIGG